MENKEFPVVGSIEKITEYPLGIKVYKIGFHDEDNNIHTSTSDFKIDAIYQEGDSISMKYIKLPFGKKVLVTSIDGELQKKRLTRAGLLVGCAAGILISSLIFSRKDEE